MMYLPINPSYISVINQLSYNYLVIINQPISLLVTWPLLLVKSHKLPNCCWLNHNFPIVFWWFSYSYHHFLIAFLWFPMVSYGFPTGFPTVHHSPHQNFDFAPCVPRCGQRCRTRLQARWGRRLCSPLGDIIYPDLYIQRLSCICVYIYIFIYYMCLLYKYIYIYIYKLCIWYTIIYL